MTALAQVCTLLMCLAASATAAERFTFKERFECGICQEVRSGHPCERYGACSFINASSAKDGCEAFCPPAPQLPVVEAVAPEIRVTKAFGTKPYDQLRISVISSRATPPVDKFFDYSSQFRYKWTGNHLHTALKTVVPGQATDFQLGVNVTVRLPKQGDGVAGALIADPCIAGGLVGCQYASKFQTRARIPQLINAFVSDSSTDFWGIFGDNFYDRTGELTADVFGSVSLEAKSKLFLSVAGNHDYWVLGSPVAGSVQDQCGNGFMQYYAQDTKAAETLMPGDPALPFDLSIDPDAGRPFGLGCNLPKIANFFWYNQIGNVALVGQSGAYSLSEAKPFMVEACAWLAKQPGVEVAVLFGHWDTPGLGASSAMAMPQWYEEMAALPGCAELDARHMLKFVMGHTHCNDPHPHGKIGAGFRVAGFGMEGCGNFGMPMLDTTGGRVRFLYFDTTTDAAFENVTSCVTTHGWRKCTQLATVWLDEPIAHGPTFEATQV